MKEYLWNSTLHERDGVTYTVTPFLAGNGWSIWKDFSKIPYIVLQGAKGIFCDCPVAVHRRFPCKHLDLVREHIKERSNG